MTKRAKSIFKRGLLLVQKYKIFNIIYLENKGKRNQQSNKYSLKHTDESDKPVVVMRIRESNLWNKSNLFEYCPRFSKPINNFTLFFIESLVTFKCKLFPIFYLSEFFFLYNSDIFKLC